MHPIKATYVSAAQGTLAIVGANRLLAKAARTEPYSLARWAASLTAICHLERMIALDVPWWNVAVTKKVAAFLDDRPQARVFEYGSGASTVWLARRAAEVTSVEHDGAWLANLKETMPPGGRVTLLHRPIGEDPRNYMNAIREAEGPFDLVVIDGRARAACLSAAIPFLKADGLILFDDSGRARYRAAIETCGLAEEHHRGLSFCVPYPDHSSLLRPAR